MCQALPCQGDGGGEGQADDKRGSQAERKSGTEGQEEGHLSRRDNHRGTEGPWGRGSRSRLCTQPEQVAADLRTVGRTGMLADRACFPHPGQL